MDFKKAERLVKELHRVFEDYPHFLIQGTALGAYRDKGFTPTERDIDIGMLGEDLVKCGGWLALDLINADFEIITVNKPFNRIRVIKAFKYGIKVDIASYVLWKDVRFCCSNLTEYSIVHPRKLLENTTSIQWFGKEWTIPKDIEGYLEREYGEDWRTPKYDHVSKSRITHFRRNEGIPNDILDKIKA